MVDNQYSNQHVCLWPLGPLRPPPEALAIELTPDGWLFRPNFRPAVLGIRGVGPAWGPAYIDKVHEDAETGPWTNSRPAKVKVRGSGVADVRTFVGCGWTRS